MWRVYPRVGGATNESGYGRKATGGLSPRGRGNPLDRYVNYAINGSIPAWAGQPLHIALRPWGDTVYPRVGGATHWTAT